MRRLLLLSLLCLTVFSVSAQVNFIVEYSPDTGYQNFLEIYRNIVVSDTITWTSDSLIVKEIVLPTSYDLYSKSFARTFATLQKITYVSFSPCETAGRPPGYAAPTVEIFDTKRDSIILGYTCRLYQVKETYRSTSAAASIYNRKGGRTDQIFYADYWICPALVPPVQSAFNHPNYAVEGTINGVPGIALKYILYDKADDEQPIALVATRVRVNPPVDDLVFDYTRFMAYPELERDCLESDN